MVAASSEPRAVHGPFRVEPEKVHEDELGDEPRLAQGEDAGVDVGEQPVVETADASFVVLAQAGPAVTEQPPPHERGAAAGELAEGAP